MICAPHNYIYFNVLMIYGEKSIFFCEIEWVAFHRQFNSMKHRVEIIWLIDYELIAENVSWVKSLNAAFYIYSNRITDSEWEMLKYNYHAMQNTKKPMKTIDDGYKLLIDSICFIGLNALSRSLTILSRRYRGCIVSKNRISYFQITNTTPLHIGVIGS